MMKKTNFPMKCIRVQNWAAALTYERKMRIRTACGFSDWTQGYCSCSIFINLASTKHEAGGC